LDNLQLSMMAYGGLSMRLKRYGVLYRSGASLVFFRPGSRKRSDHAR